MGFVKLEESNAGGLAPQQGPALELDYSPDFFQQTVPAAFNLNNTVGALANMARNTDFGMVTTPYDVDPDPNFDPFSDLGGYENYVEAFYDARNAGDVARIKRQIDQEQEAQAVLGHAGAAGLVAGLAAGVFDPINLLPFSAGVKAVQGGRVLSGIYEGAKVGLLSSAAVEPLMQASQITRTWQDAAFDIGASTLISGALGGGGGVLASVMGKSGQRGVAEALAAVEANLDADLTFTSSGRDLTRPGFINISDDEALADLDPAMQGFGGSVGAAAAKDSTLAMESLKSALGFEKILEKMPGFLQSPMIRTATSAALHVRRIAQELVETPFRYEKNTLGVASPQAVETRIKQWEAKLASSLRGVDDAFVQYRTGKTKSGPLDIARLGLGDLVSKDGKLDYHAFKEEVGRAMRRGDKHDNPAIASAAAHVRRELIEPLKEAAIKAGVLPEDVSVSTAASYLTRVYKVDRIVARRGEFEGRIVEWLKEHQAGAAARVAELEAQVAKLAPTVAELEAKLKVLNGVAADPKKSLTGEPGKVAAERSAWREKQKATIAAERDVAAAKRELDMAERALQMATDRANKLKPDDAAKDHPMREIVRDLKKGVKPPQSLASWVRSQGGVQDPGGDVKAIIGKEAHRSGGLLRKNRVRDGAELFKPNTGAVTGSKKEGWALDHMALKAWEEGFFGTREERPTINEFLDALSGDVQGWAPVYRDADDAAVAYQETLSDWDQFFTEHDIDVKKMSEAEIIKRVEAGVFGKTPEVADGDVRVYGAGDGAWTRDLDAARARSEELGLGLQYIDVASGEMKAAFMADPETPGFLLETDSFQPTAAAAKALVEQDIPFREPTGAAKARNKETEVFRDQFAKRRNKAAGRKASADAKLSALRAERDQLRLMYREAVADLNNTHGAYGKSTRQLERATNRLEADRALIVADEAELRDEARQIVDHISGAAPGRLSYEGFTITPLNRGPMKERVLGIPDERIEDFLESDIEHVARIYNRTMSADVELAAQFGRADLQEQLKQISEEYAVKRAGVTDEAVLKQLHSQMTRDLGDIGALRDRLRGTYGMPNNPGGLAVRSARMLKSWNFLRLMGGMTLSALPDLGRAVMIHGLQRVAAQGIAPMIGNMKGFRLAANEVKLAGTALDMVLDTRAMQLADVWDDYGRLSKFERGVGALQDRFGLVSLMAPWNAALKQFVGVVTQTRMLEAITGATKMTKKEAERLAYLGIDASMAKRIAKEFAAHGEQHEGGVWWANTEGWTDGEAVSAYRSALVKEVDSAIVTPGAGDKPLWTSSTLGGLIAQFKGFGFASTQRVALAGLQQRDAAALNGMLLSTALGMVSYAAATTLAGRDVSENPVEWIGEGIDRSGMLGMFSDVINLGTRSFGVGWSGSRYASRGNVEMFLGPSAGLINDTLAVAGAAGDGQVTAAETHAMRRLVPYQNLFYLRWLFDSAEAGLNQAVGLPSGE